MLQLAVNIFAHGVQDLIEFYATIARHLHFAFLDSVCRIFSLLVVVAFFSFPKIPVGRWETKQTYYGHGQGSIQMVTVHGKTYLNAYLLDKQKR